MLFLPVSVKVHGMKKIHSIRVLAVFMMLAPFILISPDLLAIQADITDISNRAYGEGVLKEINTAQKEILIAMYGLYINDKEPGNPIQQFIEALVAAHKRKVRVEVILDNSPSSHKGNQRAFEVLSEAGIRVDYAASKSKMHAKLIIIDSETVIDGSANWTQSALLKNVESNQIIRSAEFAEIKKALFKTMMKDQGGVGESRPLETLNIPAGFILEQGFAPRMISDNDQYSFDLYLALLQDGDKASPLDYKKMALRLGIQSRYYQTLIYRALKKLKSQYHLIDFTGGRHPQITMITIPGEDRINLPKVYWDYGFNRSLKLKEKFALLICLNEQELALPRPYWSISKADMEKKYHVTGKVLGWGLRGLEEKNLLEIIESKSATYDFSDRTANQ